MAPGTKHLGWLVAAAICVALVVAGCGGGSSSSAPATTGSTDAQSAKTNESPEEKADEGTAGATKEGGTPGEANGGGNAEKKPPVEQPEGTPEKAPSKKQEENVPLTNIVVTIPNGLNKNNTCKGKNVSPEMSWNGVPPGTTELEVFAVSAQPVAGKLYFDWAMAGIDPSMTSLKEGEVPDGAILGKVGDGKNGWSLCPKKSGAETYIFSVYAVKKSLSPQEGFDPLQQRVEAGENAEEVGLEGVEFSG